MSNVEIVRGYLQKFFSGKVRHSAVRDLLCDDFTLRDPLMSADSADDYVAQLEALGDEMELRADVRRIVGEGDVVAALVDFHGPAGPMPYAHWYTLRDGKIARLEVLYDPRPFLATDEGG
jgi:ketosteroid isomerase-like protein